MYDTPDESHTGLCHDLYLPDFTSQATVDVEQV